jgi:hypothetical protein
MTIQEFQWVPARWAKMAVADTVTQADVDALFTSVDTSNWVTRPTWDDAAKTLRWQVIASPYGTPIALTSGAVVCVERPYTNGVPASVGSMTQAQVLTYAAGTWSDSAVTYL